MTIKNKKILHLAPVDLVSIICLLLLTSLNIVFYQRVLQWKEIVFINIVVIIILFVLAYLAETKKTKFLIALHRFIVYPIVFFVFKEIYLMVHPIHPIDYDDLFIAIDYWIFGVNPTQWMMQFANPILTEILQIGYFSYYVFFVMFGVELFVRYKIEDFDYGAFIVMYGFYLSYLGYFLLPAVGPRFTLHDFYSLSAELPGLFFTEPIRNFVNAGESISSTMPDAVKYVQRDVFPSGHTQLTLCVLYISHTLKLKTRWIMTILAVLLIISTIYMRYHYVIDIIGGIIFFIITIYTGKKIYKWWNNYKIKYQSIL